MRLFSFDTDLTIDDIIERSEHYLEDEQHSPWEIFKDYYSARTGLHLYKRSNGYIGYYENGELTRGDTLQHSKVWFRYRFSKYNGKLRISGYTYFCPILSLAFLGAIIGFLIEREFLAFSVLTAIMLVLHISVLKDENNSIEALRKLLLR